MTRMNISVISISSLATIVLFAATVQAQPQARAVDVDGLIASVGVLPRCNQWSLVPPEQRETLHKLAAFTTEQREVLAKSDDPRSRGAAVFIAEQQGDLAALLSCSRMLEDTRPTQPYALPTAGIDEYAQGEQTVAEYLTSAYLHWFGVDVDGSLEKFRENFGERPVADRFVKPWIVRLRRAAKDGAKIAEIKTRIQTLPEETRWAVLALGYQESVYTAKEAREALRQLSPETRQAITAGKAEFRTEPYLRMNENAMGELLQSNARELLVERNP